MRKLTVAVAAMFLVAASYAGEVAVEVQSEGGPTAATAGGGGAAAFGEAARVTVPTNLAAVNGEVVMANPAEVVIRTQKGLERFRLTPQTIARAGAAQGEDVTVFYVPAQEPSGVPTGSKAGANVVGGANPEAVAFAVTPPVAGLGSR